MSDFQVSVGGDFSELLNGFKALPKAAQDAGSQIGKGLSDGIEGASSRSLAALNQELTRLQQRQTKVSVDSRDFVDLQKQIGVVEAEIAEVNRKKVTINADPSSIVGLNAKLQALQGELERTKIGSQRFKELQGEIRSTEGQLSDAGVAAGGFQNVIQQLGPAIAAIGVGTGLAAFAKGAFDAAVAAESAEVRIKALGDQFGEADKIQRMVAESAKLLNISNTDAADGFLQLYGALRPTGISLEDIGTVFTATNAAAKNFGLSAGSVQAAVLQLSQGLAAGTLQGDELRSIMEQMPPVAQAIAKEMGVTVGEVKKFGSEGKITSEIVIAAIKRMNDSELGKLGTTLQSTQERLNAQGVAWNQLSVAIGSLFVDAVLPAIEVATGIAKALTGMVQGVMAAPPAIKALIAALIGIPTVYAAATLAVAAFNTTLVQTQVTAVVSGLKGLVAILANGIPAAAALGTAGMQGMLASIVALNTTQISLGGIAAAIKTNIVAAAQAGVAAFQALAASIASGQLLTNLQTFAASTKSLLLTLAPLALAIGGLIAAFKTWEFALSGANRISEDFAESQKTVDDAINKLNVTIGDSSRVVTDTGNAFTRFFQAVKEDYSLLRLQQESEKLQQGFTDVQTRAVSFYNTIKDSGQITDEQREKALGFVVALEAIGDVAAKRAEQLRLLAEQEERAGNPALAENIRQRAAAMESEAKASENLTALLRQKLGITEQEIQKTKEAEDVTKRKQKATEDLAKAEAELNQIISSAPVRNLEAQLAVGQQLISQARALGELESSRIAISKAGIEYELQQAEKRGASELEIGQIKQRLQELDRQALEARYQGLVKQQQLEVRMLELTQQKAKLEADLSVQEQRLKLKEAEVKLSEAERGGIQAEIDAASTRLQLEQAKLGIREDQVSILQQTQPIEAAIAAIQRETALNGERAKAAQAGYRIEADGSLVAVRALGDASNNVARVTASSAIEQQRLRDVAAQTGMAIRTAADGSLELSRNQSAVATASGAIKTALGGAVTPAGNIADAFTTTGDKAPEAAQGARDFAGWLSGAKTYAERIAALPLAQQMAVVATSTQQAAAAAKTFYEWLQRASQLPGARWTGGPVEAGGEYRINELGQEAFLSAGRLSLINAPSNSIWRAPTSGTVIPAGITARLQEQGMLPTRGGAAAVPGGSIMASQASVNAQLAVEVGKLRQEVGELVRKNWDVHVQMKAGATGSQVMRQLLR